MSLSISHRATSETICRHVYVVFVTRVTRFCEGLQFGLGRTAQTLSGAFAHLLQKQQISTNSCFLPILLDAACHRKTLGVGNSRLVKLFP
jgi:hypothetical protein